MTIRELGEQLKAAYIANPTFATLAELRDGMVAMQDLNDAADGFRRLLTDLYPDTAHFIYELLQNAQDASKNNSLPSKVSFILSHEKLEFEHFGEKLFDIADIDAITSLGVSTKRDDNTSIGKFGVGFKSVFAYSNTPEIHSGNKHFRIENLFVPTDEGIEKLATDNKTVFVLPFNNPTKEGKAEYEIEQELRGLGTETLLFLKDINTIEYLLPDGNTLGSMKCMRLRADDENIIKISVNTPGEESVESYWLRYTRDRVPVVDESGKSIECAIAIAFKLEKDTTKEHKSEWKIVACNPGKVCIFFPAEKETSNLHFYIHAPFASTVARDSVRKCEANDALRDAIAELAVDSLTDIKRRNLLTVDFLGILPIPQDSLSPDYEPIRAKIISAFQEQPLLPTKSNSYAPSTALFRGPVAISDVIGDEDLAILTGHALPLWAKNAPQQNQREDRFLNSLDIDEWGWEELQAVFNPKNDDDCKKIENWISKKSDEWLMHLYALLNNENRSELGNINSSLKIVRTTKGQHVKAFDAYFAPDDSVDMPDDLNFVKPDVYRKGDAEKRKKDAETFLDILGVKRYNEREKVSLRLKRYNTSKILSIDEQYWKDIRYFFDYSAKHPRDTTTFQNEKFLIGERGGKTDWVSSAQLRIITKETMTEVSEISDLVAKDYAPWSKYNKVNLDESRFTEFNEFLKRIGAKEYTHEALLKIRVNRYLESEQPDVSIGSHLRDIETFCHDWDIVKNDLQQRIFLLGNDGVFHKASDLIADEMQILSNIHKAYSKPSLSCEYAKLSGKTLAILNKVIREIGLLFELSVIEVNAHTLQASSHDDKWLDYYIVGLKEMLGRIEDESVEFYERKQISCLIWNAIVKTLTVQGILNNAQNGTRKMEIARKYFHSQGESSIVSLLRSRKWLLRNNSEFCMPKDTYIDELSDEFATVSEFYYNPLLKAIGFGESMLQRRIEERKHQQEQEEQARRNDALEKLGLDENDLDILSKIREAEEEGIDVDEAVARERERKEKQERRRNSFPQRSASNPTVRADNTQKQYADSFTVNYEPRIRNVRVSSGGIDKQTYLRDMYTNDDGEMICQICKEEMPFKKRDGEYYFESVQLWSPSNGEKEHEAKYLALCPVCAAKYKEFVSRGEKEESFRDAVQTCDDLEIPIELGDENATVSFVEKHLIDLQAIINFNYENAL